MIDVSTTTSRGTREVLTGPGDSNVRPAIIRGGSEELSNCLDYLVHVEIISFSFLLFFFFFVARISREGGSSACIIKISGDLDGWVYCRVSVERE